VAEEKNIDNWKVFSFAGKPEMRRAATAPGPFSISFFSPPSEPSPPSPLFVPHPVTSGFLFLAFPRSIITRSRIGNQINFPATRPVFRAPRLFSTIRNGRPNPPVPQTTEGLTGRWVRWSFQLHFGESIRRRGAATRRDKDAKIRASDRERERRREISPRRGERRKAKGGNWDASDIRERRLLIVVGSDTADTEISFDFRYGGEKRLPGQR